MLTDFIWLGIGTGVKHGNKPSGFIKTGKCFELRNVYRFSAMTLLRGVNVLQLAINLEMLIVYVGELKAACLFNFLSCNRNYWCTNGIHGITEA
jgi:hypothetical protein